MLIRCCYKTLEPTSYKPKATLKEFPHTSRKHNKLIKTRNQLSAKANRHKKLSNRQIISLHIEIAK